MERSQKDEVHEQTIDITVHHSCCNDGPPSIECSDTCVNSLDQQEVTSPSNTQPSVTPSFSSSSNEPNIMDVSIGTSSDVVSRSSSSSARFLYIELAVNLIQAVASIVALTTSRNVSPLSPIYIWIMGYAGGCVASILIECWRFYHGIQCAEAGSTQSNSLQRNSSFSITIAQLREYEFHQRESSDWVYKFVERCRGILRLFFATWFLIGVVWVFGGYIDSDSSNLYRLCILFLALNFVRYTLPICLMGMICCCIGIRFYLGAPNKVKGATDECINALPTYKYKSRKHAISSCMENGEVIAAVEEMEPANSEEDAECCICLTSYVDNIELKELPCFHFFHTECADKWLKINGSCPLCKFEVSKSSVSLPSAANTVQEA